MNVTLAVAVAQEYCMPAYDQDGNTVVAFFQRAQAGVRPQMQFCVPTKDEAECTALAIRFQEMFVAAIGRYEEAMTGQLQVPSIRPDYKGAVETVSKE